MFNITEKMKGKFIIGPFCALIELVLVFEFPSRMVASPAGNDWVSGVPIPFHYRRIYF